MNRRAAIPVMATIVVARVVAGAASVDAAEGVLGAGSTFAEVALDEWGGDVYVSDGLSVEYSGNGSLGGLENFQAGVVDFASSDVPYVPGTDGRRAYRYVPIVAGGTALMYNLVDPAGNRIDNLRLSPALIADLFFGNIRNWNDPRIAAENPALVNRLPDQEVRLAVRTSGSGTTGVFTDFLSTAAPDQWNDFVRRSNAQTLDGGNYVTAWPQSGGGFLCHCSEYPGSSEIANYIAQDTPGSRGGIGYAEAAYAKQLGLPVVRIRNQAGNYRLPDARSVAVALLNATQNGDGTQNLQDVHLNTRDEAYPASSYNYLVLPTDGSAGFSAGKGETLSRYLIYSVTAGQGSAEILGYSPMPPNLVQFALDQVGVIPGAVAAPPLGDWGRFYEQLDTEVERTVVPEPDDPASDGGAQPGSDPNAGAGVGVDAEGNPIIDADNDGVPDPGTPGGAAPGTPAGAPGGTTTTVAGAAAPGTAGAGPGAAGRRTTTATSIAADGSIVYLEEDPVSGGGTRVALTRGLRFDEEGNLISNDGDPVPEVESIGIGQLLGISAVLAGLVLLPPLVIGGIIRRRREDLDTSLVPPAT